jgi:hypothetical protein
MAAEGADEVDQLRRDASGPTDVLPRGPELRLGTGAHLAVFITHGDARETRFLRQRARHIVDRNVVGAS